MVREKEREREGSVYCVSVMERIVLELQDLGRDLGPHCPGSEVQMLSEKSNIYYWRESFKTP